jgi:hypothetical protein
MLAMLLGKLLYVALTPRLQFRARLYDRSPNELTER